MLIDKNILLACGVSFTLHGAIFGVSGFGSVPVLPEIIPEEITVNIKIEKQALLPKIRDIGEPKKIKKTEQSPEESVIEEKTEPLPPPLQEVTKLLKNDPKPEKIKKMITPLPLNNSLKTKPEQKNEEAINTPDPDKEAMLDFHNMVKQRIEEARRYPLWARKKGIQGITRIAFTVRPDGTCRDMKIAGTSGSKILDHEALETLKRAEPFPSIPEKISRSPVSLEVGIVFSLQKKD